MFSCFSNVLECCKYTRIRFHCANDWWYCAVAHLRGYIGLVLGLFVAVACGEVRGWGGTLSFKANFASVWIEWRNINSPFKRLLADWILFLLSVPYHNFYTHIEAILDLKKGKIYDGQTEVWPSYIWPTEVSATCLAALLKYW